MIDISEAGLGKLAIHWVGNKGNEEGMVVSKSATDTSDEMLRKVLEQFFLKAFKKQEYYRFTHPNGLQFNEVRKFAADIFSYPDGLYIQSINILKHLYGQQEHPQVKAGELFVAHFGNCKVDGLLVDAVGIFKSENKETFLKFNETKEGLFINFLEGINTGKLDKGCIILNVEEEEGYRIMVADAAGGDARFWTDDFLQLERLQDENFQTQAYLNLCRNFCQEVYAKDEDKKEQVMFLNKSIKYFNQNDEFNAEEFSKQVFKDEIYVEDFKEYGKKFAEERDIENFDNFPISKGVVKNMQNKFRELIKLDTGVEMRLSAKAQQGAEPNVERGWDKERGMYFYVVYFNKEL